MVILEILREQNKKFFYNFWQKLSFQKTLRFLNGSRKDLVASTVTILQTKRLISKVINIWKSNFRNSVIENTKNIYQKLSILKIIIKKN